MTTKAYIFIDTSVGKMRDVVKALRSVPSVVTVDAVTGPYDVIAVLTAPDLNGIGDQITGQIHRIRGIDRTLTSIVIHRDEEL